MVLEYISFVPISPLLQSDRSQNIFFPFFGSAEKLQKW